VAGLNTLQVIAAPSFTWGAQLTVGGVNTGALSQQLNNLLSYSKTVANTTITGNVSGADEMFLSLETIVNGVPFTLDLQSFTDVCNQAAVSLARLKYFFIYLLASYQTCLSQTGNACSGITLKGGASNPFLFNWGGTMPTQTINNGGWYQYGDGSTTGTAVSS